MRFLARLFALLVSVPLLAALVGWWWLHQPLTPPSLPVAFDVKPGASVRSIGRDLRTAGVLPHDEPFVWLVRALGRERQLKAGNYELKQAPNWFELIDKLTEGDVSQAKLTIVEGTTFQDLKNALRHHPGIRATLLDLPDAEILGRLGAAEPHPEGLFFPDTYFFAAGDTDEAVLKRAYRLMQKRLAEAWNQRRPGLPYATPYQALTMASIVEKETGRAADRTLIAAVFVNRLREGMRLQTDPTVIYGLGAKFDGNLRKVDLLTDTPYNTYTRDGLPPSPIAMPGLASLQAALQPAEVDYRYFVSRGDGSSQFSSNLNDHNRAVNRYQRGR